MPRMFTAIALLVGAAVAPGANAAVTERGPIAPYLSSSPDAEIALARSAAPASVSSDATVLVLTAAGYETATKGSNGFTCLVDRSWGADFDDPEFWNPKTRGPLCLNAAATRSVLPALLQRAQWVLAGLSREELLQRTRAAVETKAIRAPEAGAMCYMLSKDGYLNNAGGHWRPHLMFYLPRLEAAAWAANAKGGPVFGGPLMVEPTTVFIVEAPNWSDGSPGPMSH